MNDTVVRQKITVAHHNLVDLERRRNDPGWASWVEIDITGPSNITNVTIEGPGESEEEPSAFMINYQDHTVSTWYDLSEFMDELLKYPLGSARTMIPGPNGDVMHSCVSLGWPGYPNANH